MGIPNKIIPTMKPKYRRVSVVRKPFVMLHWSIPLLLGIIVSFFFLVIAPKVHMPNAGTNPFIGAFDGALHRSAIFSILGLISLIFGAFLSLISWKNSKVRKNLLARQRCLDDIRALTWQEFELLVGEFYRCQGYSVMETGQGGADGGIDLVLMRGTEKIIVQCKQWKSSSIGAPVIREMFGLMHHHSARSVKIVCCGRFTKDAWAFSRGKPIDLVGGDKLLAMMLRARK